MKKVLIALAITMMAMTTLAVTNAESADAYEEQCQKNSNGDEVCVRFGPKFICVYINGVKQDCEQVWQAPTNPTEQDVPCDFLARGCNIFEASSSATVQMATARAADSLGHGEHPGGTIYVPCVFTSAGCSMWQRPGDLVLAHV